MQTSATVRSAVRSVMMMATIDDDGSDDGGTSGDGGIRNSQRMHFIGARRMPSKKVDEPRTRRDCNRLVLAPSLLGIARRALLGAQTSSVR